MFSAWLPIMGMRALQERILSPQLGPFVTGKAVTSTLFYRVQAISVLLETMRGRTQMNSGKQ